MKKIHKKIGAMALAGIVVAGGIAASGGKSNAASVSFSNKIIDEEVSFSQISVNNLKHYDKKSYDDVVAVLKELNGKGNPQLIKASLDENAMYEYIKKNFRKDKKLRDRLLVRHGVGENRKELKDVLQHAKGSGKMFYHVRYDRMNFLVKLR